jgi:hypothetical protein
MRRLMLLVIVILALASLTSAQDLSNLARAQSGGGYELTWSTSDGGGGASSGGIYTLNGTIGQPDAGAALSGGGYTLVGGFWGGASIQSRIYLPVVLKQ